MKGDFSRDSFNARKHYAGVLMQQGRVQLDADWNEQHSIIRHRFDVEAKDVIGESGGPLHDAGFQLTTADGKAVTISAGRYYVGGILCENEAAIDYAHQPDLPSAPAIAGLLEAAQTTVAILYLEAWRRVVTALDDAEIREVALGGPDTAIRSKTVWQVKALPVKPSASGPVSCGDAFPEWDDLVAPGTGLLSARSEPTAATGNLCLLPPSAGYQRLQNQLYRVEIHQGGAPGTATFKWSRDNGAVLSAIESFNGQQIVVHDLGRDATLGFSNGHSVELVDDLVELSGQPGPFFVIDHVVEGSRTVVLTTAPSAVSMSLHPKLRRWDAPLAAVNATTTADGWTVLEAGVQVKFEAGQYNSGDYWTFAARTVTADIDWPFTNPQPPHTDQRHFARLGIATLAADALTIQDCRKFFTPLAEVPPARHITGISWVNDDVIAQADLQASGLQIFFDGPVTPPPGDAGQAVVSVSLEAPMPLKSFSSAVDASAQVTLNVLLGSTLSFPSDNTLLWKPGQGGAELSNLLAVLVAEQVQQVRLRVHLRGAAIWFDGANTRTYLDGRTLGQSGFRAGGAPRVDLLFPSGEGRRSSDFESWLYVQLQLPSASLIQFVVLPPLVNANDSATGGVALDHPAPADGVTVALSSSSPSVVVPDTVVVPAGVTSATFSVTTTAPQNTLGVIVTAAATGVTLTAPLTVQMVNVVLSPAEVTIFTGHGQQFLATVTGTGSTGVTWSVQEAGGSINTTGLFIGGAAGDFHVVATSVADPSKSGTALAHVRAKGKDKEKEKEKDKDKEFEKVRAKESLAEKAIAKELDTLPQFDSRHVVNPGPLEGGNAFIQPRLRPINT